MLTAIAAVLVAALLTGFDPPGSPAAAPTLEPPADLEQEVKQQTAEDVVQPPATAPTDPAIELLDRLERSAADLRSFTADVVYVAEDALIGRNETRRGELVYHVDGSGTKRFAVLFHTIDRNGRRERRPKHYVFDGQWLAEIDQEQRQFIKRQVVPPGERLDPLKLGEGPFPLPVGQPREQVLARFEVVTMAPPTDGPLARVAETYPKLEGLVLVPRPGTAEYEEYERVELLYDDATLLPVGINVVETGGDRKTVRLLRPERNVELDEATRAKLAIDDPDPREWAVSVQPWGG